MLDKELKKQHYKCKFLNMLIGQLLYQLDLLVKQVIAIENIVNSIHNTILLLELIVHLLVLTNNN